MVMSWLLMAFWRSDSAVQCSYSTVSIKIARWRLCVFMRTCVIYDNVRQSAAERVRRPVKSGARPMRGYTLFQG